MRRMARSLNAHRSYSVFESGQGLMVPRQQISYRRRKHLNHTPHRTHFMSLFAALSACRLWGYFCTLRTDQRLWPRSVKYVLTTIRISDPRVWPNQFHFPGQNSIRTNLSVTELNQAILLVVFSACGGIRTGRTMTVLIAYFPVLA